VLGMCATATLASWSDSEFAKGSLTASVFGTESSVNNGTSYAANGTSPGATVSFSAGAMAPGDKGYFNVLVRTTANSVAGTATLGGAVLTGTGAATLGAALTYRVVRTTGTCNATAFTGSPIFVVGAAATFRALTAGQEVGVTNTLAAATASPGAATGFCYEITLPAGAANSLQGKTTTATWPIVTAST
jgi:hypothetical protein